MRNYKLKDYTNVQIGFLTILGRFEPKEDDTALTANWNALCVCGETCVVTHKNVTGKKKTTCGCGIRSLAYQPGKSGVSFYTKQGKWSAEIHVENQHIRLGMFYNFEDAVKAREEAELKYYGWNKQ